MSEEMLPSGQIFLSFEEGKFPALRASPMHGSVPVLPLSDSSSLQPAPHHTVHEWPGWPPRPRPSGRSPVELCTLRPHLGSPTGPGDVHSALRPPQIPPVSEDVPSSPFCVRVVHQAQCLEGPSMLLSFETEQHPAVCVCVCLYTNGHAGPFRIWDVVTVRRESGS